MMPRTCQVALLVVTLLALTLPAEAGPATRTVEAENGTPVGASCGNLDADEVEAIDHYLRFPALGCAANFIGHGHIYEGAVTSLSVRLHGDADEACGLFTLTGSVTGTTGEFCLATGEWADIPVTAAGTIALPFTLTWVPLDGDLSADADVDALTVVTTA